MRLTCAKRGSYGATRSAPCRRTPTTPGLTNTSSGVPHRRAESLLHLAARAHGARGRVDRHVAPPERLTRGERAQQLPAVREAERQAALCERSCRRHQSADHGVAALAVKNFAGEQIFLGYRDGEGGYTVVGRLMPA